MRKYVYIAMLLALLQSCNSTPETTLPITGTWVNLAYKDVRNKYTNPQDLDETEPALWKAKVREMKAIGQTYLVLMEVANEGKAYYPSSVMPWIYDSSKKSPVDAILDEAERCGMKVFLSTGWAKDQDDNLRDPEIKKRQLEIMDEIAALYKDREAFYGWYLPVEDCLGPVLAEHSVESVNALVARAHDLTPGKKTMISPYGIFLADFDDPLFEQRLAALTVDIIAYQDEVGCVREQFPLPRLAENWKKLRAIHDRTGVEMWANCETFTWEKGTNDRQSALIPAAYSRLLAQQVAASQGGVDRIVSFMFGGIIEDPYSTQPLGQPQWSNVAYDSYVSWKVGDKYWKLLESSMSGTLFNGIPSSAEICGAEPKLIDSKVAGVTRDSNEWVQFGEGEHELMLDFGKDVKVCDVFIRMLNYHRDSIEPADEVSISFSKDGTAWSEPVTQPGPAFPNNNHDAWIDAVLFSQLGQKARFMKVCLSSSSNLFVDEIYVNPR